MTALDVIRRHNREDGYDRVLMSWDLYDAIMHEAWIPRYDRTGGTPTLCGHAVDFTEALDQTTIRFHSPSKPFAKNVKIL